MGRHKTNPWGELPPSVDKYVKRQLAMRDWNRALKELQDVCAGCPARVSPDMEDICLSCPFEGLAEQAATISLKSQIAKIEAKSQKRKIAKTTIDRGGEE